MHTSNRKILKFLHYNTKITRNLHVNAKQIHKDASMFVIHNSNAVNHKLKVIFSILKRPEKKIKYIFTRGTLIKCNCCKTFKNEMVQIEKYL